MVSKLPSMVVSALATWDGKALAKGQKQISGFEKSIKNVAKAFGVTFGAAVLANYGKNAVKAFAENEKSAKRLETVVKNFGLAFETPFIEKNLDQISAKYGYQGEVLREAYQKLITVTGSAKKSQDLLNLSLDVAAGSGQDLLTVNQDLAALYVGNTKGLRKYNLGLTQAEISTMKYEDAVALLTKTFRGAGGAELDTYSGKMRVLTEAADTAQETIGKGLVDSLMILSGDTSVEDLADSMQTLATNTSKVLTELAKLGKGVANFVSAGYGKVDEASNDITDFIDRITGNSERIARRNVGTAGRLFGGGSGGPGFNVADERARRKAEADAAKRAKELAALKAKEVKAEKQKIALNKAAAAFDTTRISLAAALKATYDKETKLRLEALMLIEEDRGDEALKKIDELAKFQKNADMQRLAGVTEISNATLESLNKQLITELRVVEQSKLAESDKEIAREQAFSKYNAAITAAGTLMAKEAYSERVQIQLTEIARLASISATTSAANTAALLIEANELGMIDRVAKAQEIADAARLKALNEYAAALGKIGGPVDFGGNKLGAPVPNFVPPEWTKDLYNMSDSIELTPYGPVAMSPSVGGGGNTTVELTVNTGIGDPEAIARAIEDTLNQSTYRGTSVNRNTGFYAV